MMTRRGLLGVLGLAGAAAHGSQRDADSPLMAVWEQEDCPGCGLPVMFLPRQRRNRCAWCGRRVRHGLVE